MVVLDYTVVCVKVQCINNKAGMRTLKLKCHNSCHFGSHWCILRNAYIPTKRETHSRTQRHIVIRSNIERDIV